MKKAILLLACWLISSALWAQQYRLVTIGIPYSYEFNDGYADGSGVCTSCWTYAGRMPGLLVEGSSGGSMDQVIEGDSASLSFFETRSKQVQDPFGQTDYCYSQQHRTRDAFDQRMRPYCEARVNRMDAVIRPGEHIVYGNLASLSLDQPDKNVPLSFAQTWLIPQVNTYNQALGYCEPLFYQPGMEIEGGHWEYATDNNTTWELLDGPYTSRYPLDISLEELDQSTIADLRSPSTLRMRFVLQARGGGSYHGFRTASASSGESVTGSAQKIVGTYSFSIYRCSPELVQLRPKEVLCKGESTGSFSVEFDRDLFEQYEEKLLLMLYRAEQEEVFFLGSRTLKAIDLKGRTYTWPAELPPGDYLIRWMTKEGGDGEDTVPDAVRESNVFRVGEPEQLEVFSEVVPVRCFGGDDGKISLSVRGGRGPYLASMDGETWVEGLEFEGIRAGIYQMFLKDSNGCEIFTEVEVNEPDSIPMAEIVFASDATAYGADDGRISIGVSGGTPPYSGSWSKNGEAFGQALTLEDLPPGNYEFTGVDAMGCSIVPVSLQIQQPDPLEVIFRVQDSVLACAEDLTLLRAQGVGSASAHDNSYEYLWGNGSRDPVRTAVGAGTYTVTVFDKYGNSITGSYTIVAPPALTVSSSLRDISCFGAANGRISLEISGGSGPYTVDWSSFDREEFIATGPVVEDLSPGYYYYEVTDSNGCVVHNYDSSIYISQPQAPLEVISEKVTHLSAAGAGDGSISIEIAGGSPPYTFSWTGPDGFISDKQELTDLLPGIYWVRVFDAKGMEQQGCFEERSYTVLLPEALEVDVVVLTALQCHGDQTGSLSAEVKGGIPPYQVRWMDKNGEVIGNEAAIYGLGPGAYRAEVTDDRGKTAMSEDLSLIDPEPLLVSVSEQRSPGCADGHDGMVSLLITGGEPPYLVSWDEGLEGPVQRKLSGGTHGGVVEDSRGCLVSFSVDLTTPEPVSLTLNKKEDPSVRGGSDGMMRFTISAATLPYRVFHNDRDLGQYTTDGFEINGVGAGLHQVEIRDATGCSAIMDVSIVDPGLYSVNSLPPACNGDCNGSIAISWEKQVLGEVVFYWEDGVTGATRNDLCEGVYKIRAEAQNGGTEILEVILEHNFPYLEAIPDSVTLCAEGGRWLDSGITDAAFTLNWYYNGDPAGAGSSLWIEEEGVYVVEVSHQGCVYTKNIQVSRNTTAVTAEFLMSSKTLQGVQVVAIDVSHPVPDKAEWHLPGQAVRISEDEDHLLFYIDQPGTYEVGMTVSTDGCNRSVFKTLEVEESPSELYTEGRGISETGSLVYPNPADAFFYLEPSLSISGTISVAVYYLANNALVFSSGFKVDPGQVFKIPLGESPPGLYAVIVNSSSGTEVLKLLRR